MSAPLRISVLDQSPIAQGSTGAEALHNTLDLARLSDALGYHRYWVAEHHGGPMLAGPSPEVLIGPIAAATRGIRVGSGGVMLPQLLAPAERGRRARWYLDAGAPARCRADSSRRAGEALPPRDLAGSLARPYSSSSR